MFYRTVFHSTIHLVTIVSNLVADSCWKHAYCYHIANVLEIPLIYSHDVQNTVSFCLDSLNSFSKPYVNERKVYWRVQNLFSVFVTFPSMVEFISIFLI